MSDAGTRLLVVNTGSASLKLQVLDGDDEVEAERYIDPWDGDARAAGAAIEDLMSGRAAVRAVGHRVVHGGERTGAIQVDDSVLAQLRDLAPLAPLHQPRAVIGVEAARRALPGVPNVACFDTAFHSTIARAARTYALPADWRARWGLRRYGFHGLSHGWAARRVPELAGTPLPRLVTCHLGGGGSLCAIAEGRSIDTTMGFTPLEGVVMKTRSGSVDPGLVLWLQTEGGLRADEVDTGLMRHAGMAGLTGTSGDMREVLARVDAGDEDATLALEVYVRSVRHAIASMAASLGGVDALAFTGGVGEHATPVRAAISDGLGFLGIAVDGDANAARHGDGEITAAGSAVRTFVVSSREDLEIATQVRELLARKGG